MYEFFRNGLNATESFLKMPLNIIGNAFGGQGTIKEWTNISQDLIGIPFKSVRRALDRAEGKEVECEACGGATLRNITVNPEVTVVSDGVVEPGQDQKKAVLHVTGLLCDA